MDTGAHVGGAGYIEDKTRDEYMKFTSSCREPGKHYTDKFVIIHDWSS